MLYWVRGYEGRLEGVESELDWLKDVVFIGVAIAAKYFVSHFFCKYLNKKNW